VTGGRAGLEAEGEATAEEIDELSSEEAAEDRVKLVTEADKAVVEVVPPGAPRETEASMTPLSELVVEVDAEMKPDTGSTSLGSIDEVVGTAVAALDTPGDISCIPSLQCRDIPVAAFSLPICEADALAIEEALSIEIALSET